MHSQLKGKYINYRGNKDLAYAIRSHLIMLGEKVDYGLFECNSNETYIRPARSQSLRELWGTFECKSGQEISVKEFFALTPEPQPLEKSDLEQRYDMLMDDYKLLRDNYSSMEDDLDDALRECKNRKAHEAELLETIISLREENEKNRQDAQGLRKILSDTQGFLNRVY